MKLVTIRRLFNPAEADLIRSRLEAADFQVVLTHADSARNTSTVSAGGILVQVPEDEAEEATQLLEAE